MIYKLGTLLLPKNGYIRGPFGSALRRPELKSSGIPVYEQQHAIYGSRDFRFFIDEEKYAELKRFAIKPGDLIISCSGTLGRVSLIQDKDPHGIISQALLILRSDTKKVLPKFLYYFFVSNEGYNSLVSRSLGSVQVNLAKRNVIEGIEINVPPLPEQRAIARILTSLDDKIELNNRMNKTLEEMAQTIFKRWFVDFEFPDENGIPYKSSGGKMVESELGLIPEGWRVKCLYDFAQYINGTSFKKEEIQPVGVPIIKIAEIKNGISNTTNRFAGEKDKKYYLKRGDILFSWSGNPDTSIGIYVWPYDEKSVLNQHIFKVKTSDEMLVFTYFLLNYFMPQFAEIARNKQTTGLGHVTVADLKRMQHVYSTQNIFKLFDEIVGPIFDRYKQNIYENQYLTQLRDTLLPKFMSGEIRIPVMEETN